MAGYNSGFMPAYSTSTQPAFDLAGALNQGFKSYNDMLEARNKPKTLAEELLAKQLQNRINAPKAEHAEELTQADLQLKQGDVGMLPYKQKLLEAQARRQSQLADQPFGGQLSGDAREAYALELLKDKFGENSGAYQNAKRAYDLHLTSQEGLNKYRESLMGTANKRASTQLGKLDQEQQEVDQGFLPGTNGTVKLTPKQQEELSGQYELQRQKVATDTQSRQKTLLASNIDKTINSIDPKSLTQYAGIPGEISKKKEEIKAPFGKESQKYRDYTNNLKKVELLAHQVRQFYGDSIQPAVTQAIQKMTNPATWSNNPEIAMQNYNAVVDILKKESGTYSGSLVNKKEYENKNEVLDQNKMGQAGHAVLMIAPDGSENFVTIDNLEKAKKLGLKIKN